MKSKIKVLIIMLSTITLVIGSSVTAFAEDAVKETLDGSISGIAVYESVDDYIASFAEEPSTEESSDTPTTEDTVIEEPSTQEPAPTTPEEEDTYKGVAGDMVYNLIGDSEEFTPQTIMAIFVVCLALECLSHVVSAAFGVGGLK